KIVKKERPKASAVQKPVDLKGSLGIQKREIQRKEKLQTSVPKVSAAPVKQISATNTSMQYQPDQDEGNHPSSSHYDPYADNYYPDDRYEDAPIYYIKWNERTKKLHDSKIKNHIFNVGDQVLLFNSRLKIFFGKLKTHWSGPFTITQVFSYGTIELFQPNGPNFKKDSISLIHSYRVVCFETLRYIANVAASFQQSQIHIIKLSKSNQARIPRRQMSPGKVSSPVPLFLVVKSFEENASKKDDRIDKLADQILTLVEIVSKKVVTPTTVKAVEESYVTCGGNHAYYNCDATNSNELSVCAETGRSFLRTGHALIDVYGEEITLRVTDEAVTFNLNHLTRYSSTYDDMSVNRIDVIDIVREDYAKEMLGFSSNPLGGNTTSTFKPIISNSSLSLTPLEGSDFILEEIKAYLKDESILPKINHADCDPEGDNCLIEKLLNDDPFQLPPMDLKTLQRCMMAIFHDMIKKTMEVFMDDFLVFRDSFSSYLSHLDTMLQRCEDTNLVLNWEKCHFMVKEGIVPGHKISKN
nr:reverse transcriptase domain-containing protein [Tanacetum cinerariifolium]